MFAHPLLGARVRELLKYNEMISILEKKIYGSLAHFCRTDRDKLVCVEANCRELFPVEHPSRMHPSLTMNFSPPNMIEYRNMTVNTSKYSEI